MSASIETNAIALAAKFGTYPSLIKQGLSDGLDESADFGVRTMKTAHNPFSKSGKTLRSIKSITTDEFSRSIGPMTDSLVPLFLEKGTKPHIIMGNPYLSFDGKKGKVILGWKLKNGTKPGIVYHPGTTPRPFVEPARNTLKVMFPRIMATYVKNAIK
ncbi:hypothetical protein MBCUT_06820 [Methanobrevibacter cuticularis]|uniref:Uncharacterized protein n=1 Tax=Methanobrevibacter cuticularis TaxID=47311 RepID=A0A166EGY7_9EURY|nr:hypothetical protein [Methanobrevibacter cuticularis]KZX16644.1 hypothetical protein MBCUT_06820 [Methanobrevibacter cuticularis]